MRKKKKNPWDKFMWDQFLIKLPRPIRILFTLTHEPMICGRRGWNNAKWYYHLKDIKETYEASLKSQRGEIFEELYTSDYITRINLLKNDKLLHQLRWLRYIWQYFQYLIWIDDDLVVSTLTKIFIENTDNRMTQEVQSDFCSPVYNV